MQGFFGKSLKSPKSLKSQSPQLGFFEIIVIPVSKKPSCGLWLFRLFGLFRLFPKKPCTRPRLRLFQKSLIIRPGLWLFQKSLIVRPRLWLLKAQTKGLGLAFTKKA